MDRDNISNEMISIIIPVYNSAKWLRRCIDCVVTQTFTDLEILLVNDGSTDESGDICDEYASCDSRIRVIHQKNGGVSEARNTGLRNVTGEYVSFIDNDDWIHPQYFELLFRAIIETGGDMAMCYYRKIWIDEFSPDTTPINLQESYKSISSTKMIDGMLAIPIDTSRSSPIPYEFIWAKLYKKDILKDLYYKNVWAEDVEYNSRVYFRTVAIALVPQYLYIWIQSHQSLHRSHAPEGFDGYLKGNLAVFDNIPPSYGYERGKALKRLMLCVLASRHNVVEYKYFEPSKDSVIKLIKEIMGKTLKEFCSSCYISLGFKIGILTFYYIPATYNIFRWIVAKYPNMLK